MAISRRAYWRMSFSYALRKTWERADVITSGIWALAFLLFFEGIPWALGYEVVFANHVAEAIVFFVSALGIVFLWRLVCVAPYALYHKVDAQCDTMREQLSLKIRLEFEDTTDCFAYVPQEMAIRRKTGRREPCPAWWILLRATNQSQKTVHGCLSYLTAVHFKPDQSSEYAALPYQQGGPLMMNGYNPTDLRSGVPQGINVFAVDQIDQRIRVLWETPLQNNDKLFDRPGIYKLTVQITSEDGGNGEKQLELDWRGIFDKPRVRAI